MHKTKYFIYSQKKDLILSRKLFVWKTFFGLRNDLLELNKICFIRTKYLLNQIKICSNKIYFCLNSIKLYHRPHININIIICILISMFWRKIYLIKTNIYLARKYFVWIELMLFNSNNSFVWIKKSLSNKSFSFI